AEKRDELASPHGALKPRTTPYHILEWEIVRHSKIGRSTSAVGHFQSLPRRNSNVRSASISRHTKTVLSAPSSGNSTAVFLRLLHRPDFHARVLAGEIGAHASMIDGRSKRLRQLGKSSQPIETK